MAKGVSLAILSAIDRKSIILLAMILLVTAVFLLNAGVAAVRARRSELGTLLCLGWHPRQVAASVLGELVVVGVMAGGLGTGLAFGLSAALGLNQPAWRLALVAPVSIGLAGLAGLVPAIVASRGAPLDVVAPAVNAPRRPPRHDSLTALAIGTCAAPGVAPCWPDWPSTSESPP
ncbi:MAG: FtsX-like permease family protein [Jatrophihabitantaceae bacterium]